MKEIFKAHFQSDDSNIRFTMPIAKVDVERRIVSGFATLDNVDRQGDKLLAEASRQAFENFRGNVRLMHQPIPAGKVVSFKENTFYDPKTKKSYSGVFVDAYISKGAENIWQMVVDGTLTGFSIGGRIIDSEPMVDSDTQESIRLVKKYELMELSLVDSPANQFANILSIQKVNDEVIASGIATSFSVENIFWCAEDEIAIPDTAEDMECSICHNLMENVGWVESTDPSKDEEIAKRVDAVMNKSKDEDNKDTRMRKSRTVVENHPECSGGFGVVNSDGELKGCYTSMADAEQAVAQYNAEEEMDDSEDISMKEVISTETGVPSKNPQQMNRRIRRKKKVILKAGTGEVSTGDFVAYAVPKPPAATQYAKGKVESIRTSGSVRVRGTNEIVEATPENPVAIVRVYRESAANKYAPTDRRVAKKISNLRKLKPLETKSYMEKAVSSQVSSRLNDLVTQHNQKYGNVNSKRVTVNMLRQVFERGIGAYRTNPGSVRPNVASAEQWAYARVNGFLQAVGTGKFKRKPFDTDLLPSGHPLSTKTNKGSKIKKFLEPNEEGGVEVAENVEAPEELDTADSAEEVEFEVEESVEEVDEADEDLAKSVEAEDLAVDTSDQIDIEKALGDVKEFIEQTLQKSVDSSKESINSLSDSITELVKSFDEKVGQLASKYEELTKGIAGISKTQEELSQRVESVEEDTAMKKSGELETSIPEQPVMRKSLWGGRFLNSADL